MEYHGKKEVRYKQSILAGQIQIRPAVGIVTGNFSAAEIHPGIVELEILQSEFLLHFILLPGIGAVFVVDQTRPAVAPGVGRGLAEAQAYLDSR